jgi:hypothetical protein
MAQQLTAEDARQSLTAHVEAKGIEVFLKFGPRLGWAELQRLLQDRIYVRYPVETKFDATQLLPGEFAHAAQRGDRPENGFTLSLHPLLGLGLELEQAIAAALYQLVAVNYGEFASAEEAETFGAAALGLTRDEYYGMLCEIADRVGGGEVPQPDPASHACEGGGCGCGG